jgi:predicted translin family RNA/ssDNA-binding protein
MSNLPTRPSSVMEVFGHELQEQLKTDMAPMVDEVQAEDDRRDEIFKSSREILKNNGKISFAVRTGQTHDGVVENMVKVTSTMVSELLAKVGDDPEKRSGILSQSIQSFTETRMMQNFFESGTLSPPSVLQPCNDEEYLMASLGFAQQLSRYCVGRACENDRNSIRICRELILQLNEKMLQMDFRNGPLRRKYDGLKYALKNIEDVTYELSLLSGKEGESDGPPMKKARTEAKEGPDASSPSLIPSAEIDSIKERLDIYDKLREGVIKDSRDVQKLSKQAIFSIHRGNLGQSSKQLGEALDKAKAIMLVVAKHPLLRNGAFSNSLEEWAEGAITLEWARSGKVLSKAETGGGILTNHEYIGALSDFTGEIGRMAVAAASKRDLVSVRKVQQAGIAISQNLMQINTGGKFTKKVDAVNTNLRKVEDIVYDLSMVGFGGKARNKAREEAPREGKKDDDEE